MKEIKIKDKTRKKEREKRKRGRKKDKRRKGSTNRQAIKKKRERGRNRMAGNLLGGIVVGRLSHVFRRTQNGRRKRERLVKNRAFSFA
jgi:F0F1-type ATP synthase assembly protein I